MGQRWVGVDGGTAAVPVLDDCDVNAALSQTVTEALANENAAGTKMAKPVEEWLPGI